MAQTNPHVQASSLRIAQQQLNVLQQQIAAIEATLGATSTNPSPGLHTVPPMNSENVPLFILFLYVNKISFRGKFEWPKLFFMILIYQNDS